MSRLPESTVIAPEGEVDFARIAGFRAALSEAARGDADRLVVDLTDVSFIDSTGLGALVEFQVHMRRENREVAVVAPGGTAAAVLLELAGMRGRLPIFETRTAASGS
jgi:anti-anti-sigma factor